MAYWLYKTEPSTYGWADLEKAKTATWDGVANPVALRNLQAARAGDLVVIYHTGDQKQAVGIAEITREAYPDPKESDERLVVVDLAARQRLAQPVTLAALKKEPSFADSPLLRIGRLSVVPLEDRQWKALLALGKSTVP
jgi:predicted RNA-binding protein with PUA-like domain